MKQNLEDNPHRCIIDAAGYYIDFVLLIEQPDGTVAPYAYELKFGETLIEASPPGNIIKPRRIGIAETNLNGTAWEETATSEEIEAAKSEPPPPAPLSEMEMLTVEITTAMAVMQQQNDMAIAELTMAIASVQEGVNSDV